MTSRYDWQTFAYVYQKYVLNMCEIEYDIRETLEDSVACRVNSNNNKKNLLSVETY